MDITARRRFEAVAGDLLAELGYETENHPRYTISRVKEGILIFTSLAQSNMARLNQTYTYTHWLPGMLNRYLFLFRSSLTRRSN
jgi:hypothetical protein